jgi:glycosyltransferase involved in cell wall biosynthesis
MNSSVCVEINDDNRGFAAANNQGALLASGDILVFLNNDTIPPRGWIEGLMRWLEDPETGMVGPVTNRTCNEAQIDAPYRTFGELEVFASEYTHQHAGQAAEIPMLAMFCVAIRREVFERVGPLDEQFQVGMFEDDDYAQRVRQAGYKIVCAEDVFVHHFGQAALGELCIEGKYDYILESNRRRFEAKWGIQWQPHRRRITPDYEKLRIAIRHVAAQRLPSGATVLVITKGDEELLKFTEHSGWHFPRDNEGRYTNIYPADSTEAIMQLESGRANGAGFLLIPRPALWWLDFYSGFKDHLERNYVLTVRDEETCLIFDVREPATVREQYAASSHH